MFIGAENTIFQSKKKSDPFDQVYLRNTNQKNYYWTKETNEIREKETKSDYKFILKLLTGNISYYTNVFQFSRGKGQYNKLYSV